MSRVGTQRLARRHDAKASRCLGTSRAAAGQISTDFSSQFSCRLASRCADRQATPRGNVPDLRLAPQRGLHPASQTKKSPTASCRPGVVHLLRMTKYLSLQPVDFFFFFFLVHILKAVYLSRSDSPYCYNDESNLELTVKPSCFYKHFRMRRRYTFAQLTCRSYKVLFVAGLFFCLALNRLLLKAGELNCCFDKLALCH